MVAQLVEVARFRFGRDDLRKFFLYIESVVLNFEHVVEESIQLVWCEADIKEEVGVKRFQKFFIPRADIFIQAQIELLLFFNFWYIKVDDRDFGKSEERRDLQSQMPTDQDILPLQCAVYEEGIDEAEAGNAFLHVGDGFLIPLAGIVGRGLQLFYGNAHDGQFLCKVGIHHIVSFRLAK